MIKYGLYMLFLFSAIGSWSECYAAALLDPTKPANLTPDHRNVPFILSAIVIAPDHRLAVINGKIVHIGDQIDDAKVTAIEEDHVELDSAKGKLNLILTNLFLAQPIKISK